MSETHADDGDETVPHHPLSLNDSARTAAATPVRVHETIWTDGFTSSAKNVTMAGM